MLTSIRRPWAVLAMSESDAIELKDALEAAIEDLQGNAQCRAEDGTNVVKIVRHIAALRDLANKLHVAEG
jgi:hypothetical protein